LGSFGAAKLPSKPHNSKHRCVIAPAAPPFFMARALFPAPPFVLACISTAPSPNVIQVHAVRCNAGSPSPSYVSGWLSWGRSVPVPSTKNGEPWLKFRWVATHTGTPRPSHPPPVLPSSLAPQPLALHVWLVPHTVVWCGQKSGCACLCPVGVDVEEAEHRRLSAGSWSFFPSQFP
jgi:hypothetical protein